MQEHLGCTADHYWGDVSGSSSRKVKPSIEVLEECSILSDDEPDVGIMQINSSDSLGSILSFLVGQALRFWLVTSSSHANTQGHKSPECMPPGMPGPVM